MSSYSETVALEIVGLDIVRGDSLIVEAIDLNIASGEVVQLFGSNGSGKTSLLQTISGLTPIAKGDLNWYVNDDLLTAQPAQLMSYIGHQANLKPTLSGEENLEFWAALYAKETENLSTLLAHVGLAQAAKMPTRKYSAGQKRRLDLARCLLAARPFWILDEPTSSLDMQTRDLWVSEIKAHQAKGGSAVIGTHDALKINSKDVQLG